MENFYFQTINSPTNSVSTNSPLQKELIEQITRIYTLSYIEFSDEKLHIDVPEISNNVQSTIFHRRISILEQIKDSEKINQISSNGKAYDEDLEELDTVELFIKEKQNQQQNQEFANQNIKRSMKRSQTSVRNQLMTGLRPQRYKIFLKKTNSSITNNFEQIRSKRSLFTSKLRTNGKEYLKTIQVRYFGTNIAKVLFIEKEMSAIELTVLALKEFAADYRLDQSIYAYKNCTLAYQLETFEEQMEVDEEAFRRPLMRTKSFRSNDDKFKSRMGSYEERIITSQQDISSIDLEDKTITIDYDAQLACKQVEIVVNQQFNKIFGIDLNTIKEEQENYPEDLLLIVEEGKTLFYIRCQINDNLKVVFQQVCQKLQSDINLRLKFPCVHYGIEPLHDALPINQLPIHWLTVERKYMTIQKPMSSIALSNKLSSHNLQIMDEKLFGSSNSSKDGQGADPKLLHQQAYTYEEFKVILKKQNKQWIVTLGVDYFDLTIEKHNQLENTNLNLYQTIKKFLVQLVQDNKKNFKQISNSQLINVALDTNKNYFDVTYVNQRGKIKVLTFQSMPYIDRVSMIINKKYLNEACTKLTRLIKLRQNNKAQSNNHNY